MYNLPINCGILIFIGALAAPAFAASVDTPNTFSAGTPAIAAQVNQNFQALKTAVNDNDSRISAMESALASLRAELSGTNSTIADLEAELTAANGVIASLDTKLTEAGDATTNLEVKLTSANAVITSLRKDLDAVEGNSVLALDDYLSFNTDSGYATALFSGINVQVHNGTNPNNIFTTVNGLGNVIIGFNLPKLSGDEVCSVGPYYSQGSCETAGGIWALSHKTGSPNLVGGTANSYTSVGGLVFGDGNGITRRYATVGGGKDNLASGYASSVNGGRNNIAMSNMSVVNGGYNNSAENLYTSVNGGNGNRAINIGSTVGGGSGRVTSLYDAWRGGSSGQTQ